MLDQTLQNRYRLTALVGEGAMGEVYRATDLQTGGPVAVKIIAQKLASKTEMLERFRREGEALRQLRHANIVAFVDMFPLGGQHAIVMEFVPGGSLQHLLKRGLLPVERAARITLEGHTGAVDDVAFNRDGKLLASTARDGTTRVWGVK
jgi:serine/threonine protein kinase